MQGRANVDEPGARPGPAERETPGVRIDATGLTRRVRGRTLLDGVSLTVEPGEVVAIVGGSGAGKTTLLQALSAVVPADDGRVAFDGADLQANLSALRSLIGYVPQEDIIHTDLPLRTTLRYAARLRLPPDVRPADIDRTVDETLRRLNLDERADVTVGALSGGQRKRASIAVELLTRPRVFFLDEPTSGLDPATAAGLLRVIGELAGAGATVLFTTHAVADLARCDKIVFLGRGGRLAFVGSIQEALAHFRVPSVEAIYERLDASDMPAWTRPPPRAPRDGSGRAPTPQRQAGWFRQWRVLTAARSRPSSGTR
jgi:ABC-type multidrug transport system ATPase subunit